MNKNRNAFSRAGAGAGPWCLEWAGKGLEGLEEVEPDYREAIERHETARPVCHLCAF